jgi:hypothetical protein
MQKTSESSAKKPYTVPQLTLHGTLEEITKMDKKLGIKDGFTFMGQSIMNNVS